MMFHSIISAHQLNKDPLPLSVCVLPPRIYLQLIGHVQRFYNMSLMVARNLLLKS